MPDYQLRPSRNVPVGRVDAPQAPSADEIASRIDMGTAEYHENCCPFLLWESDSSLFTSMPACECGGPEMARAYLALRRLVEKIAADFGPDTDLGYLAKEALDVS